MTCDAAPGELANCRNNVTRTLEAKLRLDDLSDEEWMLVRRRIPKAETSSDAMNFVIRSSVNAILWRMRTGEPWRFIPAYYGESTSIFRRFQKWSATGVWAEITKLLAEMRSANCRLTAEPPFKTGSVPLERPRAADHSRVL